MATLNATAIDDMAIATLRKMDPPRFSQIAQALQDYEMMSHWLREDRMDVQGGIGIEDVAMDQTLGVAAHKGLYEEDDVNVGDHLFKIQVDWRHVDTHWGWEYREALMNRGRSLVVKIFSPRRAGAMIDLAQELEEKAWAVPNTTDTKTPFGVPYWIVANATTGFNGGVPTGPDTVAHTTVGNVNLTTHPNFKNYTGTFGAYTDDDLLELMRQMHMETKWKSPINMSDFHGGLGERLRYYTEGDMIRKFKRLVRMQNDNLGIDLDPLGDPIFKRHPIRWVPYLDSNNPQTDGVFQIDHAAFRVVVLAGDYLRQTGPDMVSGGHNLRVVFVDLTYNFKVIDRRRLGYVYYA